MSAGGMIPMLSPDGQSGDIPHDRVQDAVKAGFKPAVVMTSPDGQMGYVPMERAHDALSAGFKVGQPAVERQADVSAAENPGNAGAFSRGFENVLNGAQAMGDQFLPAMNRLLSGANEDNIKKAGGMVPFLRKQFAALNPIAPERPGQSAAQRASETAGGIVGGMAMGEAMPDMESPRPQPKGAVSRALLLGKTPAEAYESALKPSTTLSQGERASIVGTALKEKIPVTAGGLEKLSSLIDNVNAKMDAAIPANSPNTLNKFDVTRRLNDVANKFSNQVAPTKDLSAIAEVGNDFLATKPPAIPVKEAAAIKSGTYQRLTSRAYGEVGSATTESEKALARGIKEELIQQFPELKGLGQRDQKLLELQPVLERAVGRIGNHQLVGIGTPVVAGSVKAVTGSNKLAAVLGVMKAVLDNPAVKSRLAISLQKAGVKLPEATMRLNSYAGALAAAAAQSQRESSANPDQSPNQ